MDSVRRRPPTRHDTGSRTGLALLPYRLDGQGRGMRRLRCFVVDNTPHSSKPREALRSEKTGE